MKGLLLIVVLLVAGFFAFQQLKPPPPAPPPPPPPPPPAILLEPAPVISEAEQAKVIRSTNDQDPNVRWEALVFLEKMKSPKAYPLLFEKLHKDPDHDLKLKIIDLLASRRGQEISQNLVWALKDQESSVRVAALRALNKLGDYATAPAITEALRDQEDSVRLEAIKTLNSLQERRTAEIEAERQRYEQAKREAEARAKQQQQRQ